MHLEQAYLCLNTYGKDPEYLETAMIVFNRVLQDYSMTQIDAAFTKWMKTSSTMPTPADIVGIIEKRGEPLYPETKKNLLRF